MMLIVGLSVVGCQNKVSAPDPFDLVPRCGASNLKGLIGQDAAILSEVEITSPLRVVRAGEVVTTEIRPDRLNVFVDESGVITRVWCS